MTQTAEQRSRTTLVVGIGVVLLLAISIAVAAARGPVGTPIAQKPAEAATESTQAPASETPEPSTQGTVSAVPPGLSTKPGTPGASKPGSKSKPNPGAPQQPAAQGSKLATLTVPPDKTIGMIVVPKGFRLGTYDISFEPFGWGPSGQDEGRLVARITAATPTDAGAESLDKSFVDRNATLWCARSIAEAIELGGSYTGVMQVRPQGDVGVLYLTEVKAKK